MYVAHSNIIQPVKAVDKKTERKQFIERLKREWIQDNYERNRKKLNQANS